ncbi:MAG: tol-pal system protein YbgF [Gammaproteobacteria bacterium]
MRTMAIVATLGMGLLLPSSVLAQSLESRVERLERLLENQILREMLQRLEDIQREVRELRGEQEVHEHRIGRLMDRQRELYLDVDRRLAKLERVGGSAGVGGAAPADTTADAGAGSAIPGATTPEQGSVTSGVPAAADVADAAAETADYENAFNLVTEGRYEQAQKALATFLQAHPDGRNAPNAQYYLGEAHYLTSNFDQALKEYRALLTRYPDSGKRASALMKIGFVYYEKNDMPKARQALEQVVREYAGSTQARLASQRLKQMKSDGLIR